MTKDAIANEELAEMISAGFSGLEERMATKDDLAGLRTELKDESKQLDERLGSVEQAVGTLQESVGNVERRVGSMDQTLAEVKDTVEAVERATSDTYDLLSGRVGKIERQLERS